MAQIKVEPDGHLGETSSTNLLATKAKERHNHKIQWTGPNKSTHEVTCDCEGTITDVLMRTTAFKELAEKNKEKELVILKEGRAIAAHFPCSLITDDKPLIIKYAKKEKKVENIQKESNAVYSSIANQSEKVILFHLCTSGSDNIKIILKNLNIKSIVNEMTVYAYEGETVERALQRDGRFNDSVFEKNCGLIQLDTENISEFSNGIHHSINDKLFRIYLKTKNKQLRDKQTNKQTLKRPSGNISEAFVAEQEDQDPSRLPTTTEIGDDSTPNKKSKQIESEALVEYMHEIPESEEIVRDLTQRFNEALDTIFIDRQGTNKQEQLREEYQKNEKKCREVRVMKKLMKLSDSICLILTNDRPIGTGFLLFNHFVLTNFHVVQHVLRQPLRDNVFVHFMYEDSSQVSVKEVKVQEVVAGRYELDQSGNNYDWALLKLDETSEVSCSCLLEHFGYLPPTGGLCIIGHPDCGVKKIDPCYIIPVTEYRKAVIKHQEKNPEGVVPESRQYKAEGCTQWVGSNYFDCVKNDITGKKPIVGYSTCFYYGSSGSPVFDNNCKVVAVHSGGYLYKNKNYRKRRSIIDYGFLLSNIIEDMIIQLVDRKRWDVLKKCLSVDYIEKENIKDGVKQLIKHRGLTEFKDALQLAEVTDNSCLKDFFDFICQEEEIENEV